MIDTAKSLPMQGASEAPREGDATVPAGRLPAWQLTVPRIAPPQAAMVAADAWRHLVLIQVVPARTVIARRLRRNGDEAHGAGLQVDDQDQLVATKNGALSIDHLGHVRLLDVHRSPGLEQRPKTVVIEGSVVIDGPVGPNWCVRASGDVEIRGFVNDATIVAGGSVLVRGDVTGSNSGSMIVAGWDVLVGQAADTEILAGHHIAAAQQLLNCNVTAGGRILVGCPSMKSGIVSGGIVHAGRELALFRAGAAAAFPPELAIGPMPSMAGVDDRADAATQSRQLAELRFEVDERLRKLEGPRTNNDMTQLRQTYRSLWGIWLRERDVQQLSDGEACLERIAVFGSLSQGSVIAIGARRVTQGHDMSDPTQFVLQGDQIASQRAEPLERPAPSPAAARPTMQANLQKQAKRLAVKLPPTLVHELDLVGVLDTTGIKDRWAILSRLEGELRLAESRGYVKRLLVRDPETGVPQGHCYKRLDVERIANALGIKLKPMPRIASAPPPAQPQP